MVKKRSVRKNPTARGQSSKYISDESDVADTQDAAYSDKSQNSLSSLSDVSERTCTGPKAGLRSNSKIGALETGKSLMVKVVDIQKSSNFNISHLNIPKELGKGNQSVKTDLQAANTESKGINNKAKAGSVVNRVVTRSRKPAVTDIPSTKVAAVGVIKSTKRVVRNVVKQEASKGKIKTEKNEEHAPSIEKCKNMDIPAQSEDEDPCMSGDIMYEQVIEDVAEEQQHCDIKNNEDSSDATHSLSDMGLQSTDRPSVIESLAIGQKKTTMVIDSEPCSVPSSSSDCVNFKVQTSVSSSSSKEFSNQWDDSKVSSSSALGDSSCGSELRNPVSGDFSESIVQNVDGKVSLTETHNIVALSSLKLDPETEPVSSSKTDSYFEPIFSIEEPTEDAMEVDTDICDQSIGITEMHEFRVDNSTHNASFNESISSNCSDMLTEKKITEVAIFVDHDKTINSSINIDEGHACNVVGSTVNSSKESVPNDCNDSDMPLVVNRCITETRKYMGPKGIIRSISAISSDSCDTSKEVVCKPSSANVEICSSYNSDAPVESVNEPFEKLEIKNNELPPNDKCVPMSPKELFMKSYSSLVITEDSSIKQESENSDVLPFESDKDKTTTDKPEPVSLKEVIMKNCETTDSSCPAEFPDKNISAFSCRNKSPTKVLDSPDLNVRRSRRNSAEKAKKTPVSLPPLARDKKDLAANKSLNSLDINVESKDKVPSRSEKTDPSGPKTIPSKAAIKGKVSEKNKKDIVTMSSILNEKSKPMSPKELIKKSFIANETRSMEPPKAEPIISKNSVKADTMSTSNDDNMDYVDKSKLVQSNVSSSTEEPLTTNADKLSIKTESQSSNSSLLNFDADKPVKVKSRWRRTSELEMVKGITSECMDIDSSTRLSFSEDSKPDGDIKPAISELEKLDDETIVAQRMNSFTHITANEYLTERYISKETKRMLCDCTLTKEETPRGEKGCGEDCLNRLLLIECGPKCPLGKLCSNKCFENRDYSKCKVVNMAAKGMGVIASENIPGDHFIMEYVGEVLDPKEFRRRAKEYSKEMNAHFYFMSLKADTVIDATHKGNISRFINHSCDPNAETQKWTVNGELRIGFFSKRPIAVGEEITFDYQLERYGKEAQKCYCGSSNCRGWLGENPDNDESDEDSEESEESEEELDDIKVDKEKLDTQEKKPPAHKLKKDKKKLPTKRKEIRDTTFNPDGDLEDEIDKLSVSGIKNQKHTLALSRLIVRATEERSRTRLLALIKGSATPCLRLFLDYHGLNLLWSWMVDPRCKSKLKAMIMETLFILPIQNKTILKDSKVLSIIEKWASSRDRKSIDSKERGSTEEENSNSPTDYRKDESSLISIEESEDDLSNYTPDLIGQAGKLLDDWANLKEEFRIPRKQRVEQMKEHEREADMEYMDPRENQSYNRRRFRDRKESRFDKGPGGRFDEKKEEWGNWQNPLGKMSKEERRHLFAQRVKKEEREKKESEELWFSHKEQCKALGVNPSQTAMFHPRHNALAFYHKETNSWLPYQEGAESYASDEEGGVVVNHHQPPPPYPLDYQQQLPPPGGPPGPPPGFYQQGFQPVFGQFNQALLFQPPPPPPSQQFNIPPNQPLPYQPGPLAGPPLGPHVLPHQGPLIPPGTLLPPQGPPLPPHGPPLPPQHCPPFAPLPPQVHPGYPPHQGYQPPPSPHQGPPTPLPGLPPHPNSIPPVSPHPNSIPPASPHPNPLVPLPGTPLPPQIHPVPQQFVPPLPQSAPPPLEQPQTRPPLQQQGAFTDSGSNSMEVQQMPTVNAALSSVPLKLPPKWKTAKDKEGRLYYYHVKKRISQWMFPYAAAAAAFNSEPTSDSSSDDSSSSSSEEDEEEEEEEEEDSSDLEQENTVIQNECEEMDLDSETPGSSKKRKPLKNDLNFPSQIKKPKESSLVSTIIIPREEAAEMVGITKKKIRDNKEKVKREKARAARRQRQQAALQAAGCDLNVSIGSISSKCEADTSSGPKRKIKEIFMLKMANVVVQSLNQYRKHDCKVGRITSTKDFKALAKKLTHFIMVKELRHCVNVEDLECNDNVKHKARDFIRKYMSKFGPFYVNPKED